MKRFSDWEERLSLYIDRVFDEPFCWGEHDCALFAAGAVKAMTGVDMAADFRGRYGSRREAAQALRAAGYKTLHGAARHWLGKPKHPALAHRGDIVMRRQALGVCFGRGAWFVGSILGRSGLFDAPLNDCRAAWSVPFVGDA